MMEMEIEKADILWRVIFHGSTNNDAVPILRDVGLRGVSME